MGRGSGDERPTVVVSVLTYRRPDDLAALLPMLDEQAAGSGHDVRITVVDNDPVASAREQCAVFSSERLRYVHEPRPGIAAARNRALDDAADRDVLVFVDDDERPGPGWLDALLATFAGTPCAGVVGPVVSAFAEPLEPWVREGGFFDRRRLPTGSEVTVAATNNLLLDMDRVRVSGLRFDERFGITGGSDNLFTRALVADGARLVWCDEAVVTDVVPAHRSTRDWVLRRRLRIGNSWSRASLVLAPTPLARLRTRFALAAHGGVRVGGGLLITLLGRVRRDLRNRAGGVRTLVHGLGIVGGAFGYTYAEYRRPPAGS